MTLEKAIELAAKAHAGQVDKGGHPYILHPLRVMMDVEGEYVRMAAVLHDVVEDSVYTVGDLIRLGFPQIVIDAVIALTRPPGMSRMEAAQKAAANPIARVVKMADARDNMDLSRIPSPTKRDYERAAEYQEVYFYLASHEEAAA